MKFADVNKKGIQSQWHAISKYYTVSKWHLLVMKHCKGYNFFTPKHTREVPLNNKSKLKCYSQMPKLLLENGSKVFFARIAGCVKIGRKWK